MPSPSADSKFVLSILKFSCQLISFKYTQTFLNTLKWANLYSNISFLSELKKLSQLKKIFELPQIFEYNQNKFCVSGWTRHETQWNVVIWWVFGKKRKTCQITTLSFLEIMEHCDLTSFCQEEKNSSNLNIAIQNQWSFVIWRLFFAKKRKICQITTLPFIEFNGTLWFDEFFSTFRS